MQRRSYVAFLARLLGRSLGQKRLETADRRATSDSDGSQERRLLCIIQSSIFKEFDRVEIGESGLVLTLLAGFPDLGGFHRFSLVNRPLGRIGRDYNLVPFNYLKADTVSAHARFRGFQDRP